MTPADFNRLPDPAPVDPAVVERIAASLRWDLHPVKPLAPSGAMVSGLFAIWLAVAVAGGAVLGFLGWRHLSAGAIAAIFPALAGLALLISAAAANEMVPGSKRPVHPALLLAAGCVVLAGIFFLLFPDHRTDRFVRQGIVCLRAGLIWSIPAGAGVWLILHRGYAVDRRAAGIAAGAVAGLAGLAMLELHCPNFRMPHIVVWHIAVPLVSALAGWAIYFFGSKRKAAELMQ